MLPLLQPPWAEFPSLFCLGIPHFFPFGFPSKITSKDTQPIGHGASWDIPSFISALCRSCLGCWPNFAGVPTIKKPATTWVTKRCTVELEGILLESTSWMWLVKLNVLYLQTADNIYSYCVGQSTNIYAAVTVCRTQGQKQRIHQSLPSVVQHRGVWSQAGEKYSGTIPSEYLSTAKPSGHFFILCIRPILKEFWMYLKCQHQRKPS